jgi:alpha-L-rhamnosidase
MRPHPVGDLTFVKASFRSPFGLIRSEWQKDAGRFDWQITVPPNTTATVYVPAASAAAVTETGQSAKAADGVKFVREENGHAVFDVTSGSYQFVVGGASDAN